MLPSSNRESGVHVYMIFNHRLLCYEYVDRNLEGMSLPQNFFKIRSMKLYHSVNQTVLIRKPT